MRHSLYIIGFFSRERIGYWLLIKVTKPLEKVVAPTNSAVWKARASTTRTVEKKLDIKEVFIYVTI